MFIARMRAYSIAARTGSVPNNIQCGALIGELMVLACDGVVLCTHGQPTCPQRIAFLLNRVSEISDATDSAR